MDFSRIFIHLKIKKNVFWLGKFNHILKKLIINRYSYIKHIFTWKKNIDMHFNIKASK